MSPGPLPQPRLLRDVREGYPRLSGSGGRGRLRPHATWGEPGCRAAGVRRGSPSLTHKRPAPSPAPPITAAPAPHTSPSTPVTARTALSHSSHPLTPNPRAEPGPASRGHQTGSSKVQDGDSAPPPPPPYSWRSQGAPSIGHGPRPRALAPEAQLKIARPQLYLV